MGSKQILNLILFNIISTTFWTPWLLNSGVVSLCGVSGFFRDYLSSDPYKAILVLIMGLRNVLKGFNKVLMGLNKVLEGLHKDTLRAIKALHGLNKRIQSFKA